MVFLCSCSENKNENTKDVPIDTIPMLVTQIQKCSRLYTTEIHVHKIITHSDQMKLEGSFMKKDFRIDLPLGDRRIAIPLDATMKAYIDFQDFNEKNVRRQGNKITIILPDPRIVLTGTKINHKEVKQYVALTRSNFSDAELSNYEQQGRASIIQSLPQSGLIENARRNAASILIPMIQDMGYAEGDITITFRKEFTTKDIGNLIEKSIERVTPSS